MEQSIAEAASVRTSPTDVLIPILGVVAIIALCFWLYRLFRKHVEPDGPYAFFRPTILKSIPAILLSLFALYGLFSCFVTDIALPPLCNSARIIAFPSFIPAEIFGDLVSNDAVVFLFVAVITIFWPVHCLFIGPYF